MKDSPQTAEDIGSLDELIETRLQALFDKLARPHTVEEIQADLKALSHLVYSYACRDQMLEELLDGSTTGPQRSRIYEAFKAQRVKLAENRAELERLHAKSHQLLERSILLMAQAQRQIDQEGHNHTADK